MATETKKTPAQIVAACLVRVKYYAEMHDGATKLLAVPEVKNNPSILAQIQANVALSRDKVEENSNKILRRAMEKIASNPGDLEKFAFSIFPTAAEEMKKLAAKAK